MKQVFAFAACIVFAAGCGRGSYDAYMAAAKAHIQHQWEFNEYLEGKWSDPAFGIALRPPKPTRRLSPAEAQPVDRQIAEALGPQLLATFRSDQPGPAGTMAMYVVGTRDAAPGSDEAAGPGDSPAGTAKVDVKLRVRTMLKDVFKEFLKGPEEVRRPIQTGGMRTMEFWQALMPAQVPATEPPAAGAPRVKKAAPPEKAQSPAATEIDVIWKVYFISEKSADVVIGFAFPKDDERIFSQRIDLCLETVAISIPSTKPSPASSAGASAEPLTPGAQPPPEGGSRRERRKRGLGGRSD